MLTRLEIDSFQGFEYPQSIELAPITMLFGPNSGGKSSVLRALRLLSQWDPQKQRFSLNGPFVQIGSYESAVFSGDSRKHFQLGVWHQFRPKQQGKFSFPIRGASEGVLFGLQTEMFAIDYEFDSKGSGVPLQIELRHEFRFRFPRYVKRGDQFFDKKTGSPIAFDLFPYEEDKFTISLLFRRKQASGSLGYELKGWGGDGLAAVRILSTAKAESSALPEIIDINWTDEYAHLEFRIENALPTLEFTQVDSFEQSLLGQYLFRCRQAIQYLPKIRSVGPLRQIARGFDAPNVDSNLAPDGSNIAHFFASLSAEQVKKLNRWLGILTEDRYEITVITQDVGKNGEDADGYRLTGETLSAIFLRDRHTKTSISLANAGVGISQVLPILAQLASWHTDGRERNGASSEMLLIEQPELHLHPKMQADLASILVESVLEAGASSSRQVVIETHSEAMMLRLQRLIREGELSREALAVLYVDRFPGGGNIAQELRLEANGQFKDSWPSSFSELRWAEDELG